MTTAHLPHAIQHRDARRRCTDFTVGRPWGWLERTGWGLGYLLMEIAPGCDEAGTDIFLEVV